MSRKGRKQYEKKIREKHHCSSAELELVYLYVKQIRICDCILYLRQCKFEECEYLLLAVMSELSTVRCDRALGFWLQVHGRQVSTESCRGDAMADGPCGGRR